MKKKIDLRVNGQAVAAEVEPRLQLADFVRDHLLLTGTHLGCEHGVCGACTLEIDGAPARSCITYAVACDGADVRTIEGFDDDAVMAELREAFSAEHALQCGYCTPGMLVTARDIVLRLPDAAEARIRKELAGNLCRCTGYVGIVKAIQSVLQQRIAQGRSTSPRVERSPSDSAALRSGRTGSEYASVATRSPDPTVSSEPAAPLVRPKRRPDTPESKDERQTQSITAPSAERAKPQTTLHQSFTVDHPLEKVWDFFGRLDEVTLCLPGTSLIGTPTPQKVETRIRIKVGPIVAEFEGTAEVERDASNYSGLIHGSARDTRSSSATRGEIRYVLYEEKGGAATRVEVDVGFTLTGTLAQFGRSGIVQDIAKRMTAAFAQNLEARLGQPEAGTTAPPARARDLDAGSLVASVIWNRLKRFLRSLIAR
ncbi:MAG TPA: 2Fe-2S iron-sulfur cluster-binding protein [Burkholderiales bacterium]|nr:2Fe-2S iron-sulfur cluster-binding protein [Burkholderiales bacterium]